MRHIAIAAAFIALTACSNGTGEPADVQTEEPSPGPVMAADGAPPEGRYRATSDTGVVLLEDLRPDGTYIFTDEAGEIAEEGRFEQKSPETPCFTPDVEGAKEKCYVDAIGEDSIWRTTDPDTSEVWVLERIGAE
ncbi:MAG: hypothetical protein ABJ205_04160 [Erythrobacter sp.]|uniref:hypothetical protein n=1 Tax=Erythrobacter sp. TaxID=1042 RepID=UPI003267BDDE